MEHGYAQQGIVPHRCMVFGWKQPYLGEGGLMNDDEGNDEIVIMTACDMAALQRFYVGPHV